VGPEGPRAIVRDGRRWLAFGAPRAAELVDDLPSPEVR
jgi:hypothetical protein